MLKNRRMQSDPHTAARAVARRSARSAAGLAFAACALAWAAPLAHADVIVVKNKALTGKVVLSDLTVYKGTGADRKKEVILKANDASDDVEIPAGQTKRFDTDLLGVDAYDISITTSRGEHEWKRGREVTISEPEEVSYFDEARGERPVHCSVSPSAAGIPLPPGETYLVEEGATPELPGLFFGLTYDVETGEILDPYTGPVVVREEKLDVAVEPDAPCIADCDGDGELTFFDFLCFQNAFAAGCR